jgi:hypothetical protein
MVIDGIIWYQIAPDGTRWYQMVPDGTRWYQMVPDGTRWYQLVPDGTRWNQMEPDCTRWNQIVPDGIRWYQMVLDGTRWYQIVPDGTRSASQKISICRRTKIGLKSRSLFAPCVWFFAPCARWPGYKLSNRISWWLGPVSDQFWTILGPLLDQYQTYQNRSKISFVFRTLCEGTSL